MRLLGPLLQKILAAVVLAQLVAWWMAAGVFPLSPAQVAAMRPVFAAGAVAQCLLVALAAALLTRPLRRALALEAPLPAAAGRAVAAAAYRLPDRLSAAVLLAGAAFLGLCVAVMQRLGVPVDISAAGAGVGIAATILGAMAVYTLAASAAARVLERLGPGVEVAVRGTVRGKILVVGFGLNTIALLLFAATGYVRYRADVDREYVAAAERAQRAALLTTGEKADPELAEHVWLVTSAPTALVGPGGGVVARFGGADVPFDRAGDAPGVRREERGWLVSTRAPGGALVTSWLPEEPLRERRRTFWYALASTGLVVYLAAAALAWMAARSITIPFRSLGRAADQIAAGDLTVSPPSVSQDEVGLLAADFRRMAQGLKALVVDVRSASANVSEGAREAGGIGERVRTGALGQHQGVVAVQAAVGAMDESVSLVSRGVGALSDYVAATTAAVGEMAAALEEIRKKGAELDRTMGTALGDVESLAGAGREAEATLGELEGLASHAGGTLTAVKIAVAALERAAGESEANAALVAEMAERSGGVVEETVHGIETLRAAVSDAHRRVSALGRRSDDIDQVVDFISEVAGRTNLLSLNASIIAAQAGEHGKAFAVVAEQIRDLAAQIARSTKSIGDIIHAVREDVEATAALIDRGDALAVEGVQLARNSLEALAQIQRTTAQGRETAGAIRASVEAHASSSREVAHLVESVTSGSRAVAAAVQLVGRSVAAVGSVSRSVNALAEQVSLALEDQAGQGRRQMESLSRLERMIADITRAVENHNAATRRVRDALGHLSRTAGDHEAAVEGLSGVSERLGSRARALAERIDRFKV